SIGEAGYAQLASEDWAGMLVKSGTPAPAVAQLNAAINKALKTDKVRESLAKLGTDPGGGTPEAFGALLHGEIVHWTKVVKDANIKVTPKERDMTACDFRVTLLGTGVPIPRPDRFGPCTLVEAGDRRFLIDAGRGATIRLYQLEVPIGRIDVQLLTHYHSDHTSGVPDVWLTGWLESHFGTRPPPYRVVGPTGARELMENLERAYALDIRIRVADEKLPLSGIATDVTEFDRDGVVYDQNGVKVIAFEVDHGDVIKPCYGYRFEYGGAGAGRVCGTPHPTQNRH